VLAIVPCGRSIIFFFPVSGLFLASFTRCRHRPPRTLRPSIANETAADSLQHDPVQTGSAWSDPRRDPLGDVITPPGHRTPILCPTPDCLRRRPAHAFSISNMFLLLGRFSFPRTRPRADPPVAQRSRVLTGSPFLSLFDRAVPCCWRWRSGMPGSTRPSTVGALFNLLVRVALAHRAFTALATDGHLPGMGLCRFWGPEHCDPRVWIIVMGIVLGQTIRQQRNAPWSGLSPPTIKTTESVTRRTRLPAHGLAGSSGSFRHHPKRELWVRVVGDVIFSSLARVWFFWSLESSLRRSLRGIPDGRAVVRMDPASAVSPAGFRRRVSVRMCAPNDALLSIFERRMS